MTNLPKSPEFLPVIQSIQSQLWPLEHLEACAARYGDLFAIRLWRSQPIAIASHPDAIQAIAIADGQHLTQVNDDKIPGHGRVNPIPGWVQGCSTLSQPHFESVFQEQQLRTYGRLIRDITLAVMNDWPLGAAQWVHVKTSTLSRQIILRVVFGIEDEQRFQRLAPEVTLLLQRFDSLRRARGLLPLFCLHNRFGWSPWQRLLHRRQRLDRLLETEIRDCLQPPFESRNDLLNQFVTAEYEATKATSASESDTELRNSVLGFLFICHETVSAVLVWALYWIHRSPGVRDRVLHELDALGAEPDAIAVSPLPYLTAVCLETLRLRPVFPFRLARIVKQSFQLRDYCLEKGTILLPCGYLVHRCPELYPDPDCFQPERFLGKQFSPDEYFPFGDRSHTSLGASLALFEMKLVLATMLLHFRLTLVDNRASQPLHRTLKQLGVGDVKMIMRRRLRRTLCPQINRNLSL